MIGFTEPQIWVVVAGEVVVLWFALTLFEDKIIAWVDRLTARLTEGSRDES